MDKCSNDDDTVCELLEKIAKNVNYKFVVTVTGTEGNYVSDKTLTEIRSAQEAGKIIECHFAPFTLYPLMMTDAVCSFSCDVSSTSTTCQRTTINITASGVGVVVINYALTPVA